MAAEYDVVVDFEYNPDGQNGIPTLKLKRKDGEPIVLKLLESVVVTCPKGPDEAYVITTDSVTILFVVKLVGDTEDAADCGPCKQALGIRVGSASEMEWIIRQYCRVEPPDQNHDATGYESDALHECCSTMESCGAAWHGCVRRGAHGVPCLLTCGIYPSAKYLAAKDAPPAPSSQIDVDVSFGKVSLLYFRAYLSLCALKSSLYFPHRGAFCAAVASTHSPRESSHVWHVRQGVVAEDAAIHAGTSAPWSRRALPGLPRRDAL